MMRDDASSVAGEPAEAPVRAAEQTGMAGSAWPTTVTLLLTAVGTTLAWSRLFGNSRAVLACVAAGLVAGGLIAAAHRWRWPLPVVALLSIAGWQIGAAACTVPLTGVGAPTPISVRTVAEWLPSMVSATLEHGLPADPHGQPLLLAWTLTWLCASASIGLSVYREARAAALAPLVGLFAVALLLGSPRPTSPLRLALPVVVGSLVFLAVTGGALSRPTGMRNRGERERTRGIAALTAVRGLAPLSVAVALAIALGSAVPTAWGTPPSLQREPGFDARRVVSPLTLLTPQLRSPTPRELFVVRDAPEEVDRITTAVLDSFDGEVWQSTGQFRPVGEVAPDDPRPAHLLESGQMSIEIRDLEGPWLPRAGRVQRLRLRGMQSDSPGGNHVVSSGVHSGMQYVVDFSLVPAEHRQELVTGPITESVDSRFTALPAERQTDEAVPEGLRTCTIAEIATTANVWAGGVSGSGQGFDNALQRATAIETRLTEEFSRVAEDDPDETFWPGHSLSDMCSVLGIGPQSQKRPAYDEQFASIMATMLRALGLPSRVAVGYRLTTPNDAGEQVVTEHDAAAWTEVHLGGAGWVSFDPTPGEDGTRDVSTKGVTSVSRTPVPPPTPTTAPPTDTPPTTVPAPSPEKQPDPDGTSAVALVAGGLALLVVAVVGTLTGIVLYKRRRRSRRRNAKNDAAVVAGAWFEVLDGLRDRGVTLPESLTPRETALAAAESVGVVEARQPLLDLSRLFGRATYSTRSLDHDAASRSWDLVTQIESMLNKRFGPGQTLRSQWSSKSVALQTLVRATRNS